MSDLIIILLQHIIQGPVYGFFVSRGKLILINGRSMQNKLSYLLDLFEKKNYLSSG